MSRAIIRSDDILGGRWRLEGTTVPIALIRIDARYGERDTLAQYRFIGLTAEELATVLAFEFPDVRRAQLTVDYASVTVHCVCGEDTPEIGVSTANTEVHCVCGRKWRLETTQQLVTALPDPRPRMD